MNKNISKIRFQPSNCNTFNMYYYDSPTLINYIGSGNVVFKITRDDSHIIHLNKVTMKTNINPAYYFNITSFQKSDVIVQQCANLNYFQRFVFENDLLSDTLQLSSVNKLYNEITSVKRLYKKKYINSLSNELKYITADNDGNMWIKETYTKNVHIFDHKLNESVVSLPFIDAHGDFIIGLDGKVYQTNNHLKRDIPDMKFGKIEWENTIFIKSMNSFIPAELRAAQVNFDDLSNIITVWHSVLKELDCDIDFDLSQYKFLSPCDVLLELNTYLIKCLTVQRRELIDFIKKNTMVISVLDEKEILYNMINMHPKDWEAYSNRKKIDIIKNELKTKRKTSSDNCLFNSDFNGKIRRTTTQRVSSKSDFIYKVWIYTEGVKSEFVLDFLDDNHNTNAIIIGVTTDGKIVLKKGLKYYVYSPTSGLLYESSQRLQVWNDFIISWSAYTVELISFPEQHIVVFQGEYIYDVLSLKDKIIVFDSYNTYEVELEIAD